MNRRETCSLENQGEVETELIELRGTGEIIALTAKHDGPAHDLKCDMHGHEIAWFWLVLDLTTGKWEFRPGSIEDPAGIDIHRAAIYKFIDERPELPELLRRR